MRLYILLITLLIVTTPTAWAETTTFVTIYSKATAGAIPPEAYRPVIGQSSMYNNGQSVPGYALIKEQRTVELNTPISEVSFADVAAYIDPTTVLFHSLSDPKGTRVVEQRYMFDLVNREALLNRFIGHSVTVGRAVGTTIEQLSGTLMGADGGVILQGKDGTITLLDTYASLQFPELPQGLITKPTLVWDIETKKTGKQQVLVSYQTSGITWWADYNIVYQEGKDDTSGTVDIQGWVSILNQSGASYKHAALKLVAGDVERAQPAIVPMLRQKEMMMATAMDAQQGFSQTPFFEYHLYTLGRTTDIDDHTTKQLELFPAIYAVPAKKELLYRGQYEQKPSVYLLFDNTEKHGLGIPLPAGRIRVSKEDTTDGNLEFIGENVIDHTPKGESIRIKLGSSFDVVGERNIRNSSQNADKKERLEDIEITLKNKKDKDITVIVEETFDAHGKWEITKKSHNYSKKNATTVQFTVTIPANKELTVAYSRKYSW